jgi:UrcA family protein
MKMLHAILPFALLLPTGALPAAAQSLQTFDVAVSYNPGDSAERIYSDIRSAARDACAVRGKRPLSAQKIELACRNQVIGEAVAKIGRPDVAAIHNGHYAATDTRG